MILILIQLNERECLDREIQSMSIRYREMIWGLGFGFMFSRRLSVFLSDYWGWVCRDAR